MQEWVAAAVAVLVGVPSWLAWGASRRARREALASKANQQAIADALGPIASDVRALRDHLDQHLAVSDREHRDLADRIRSLESVR